MSKTRSIDEIRRSIASLVAEAEAALAVGTSPPVTAAKPSAPAAPSPTQAAAPAAAPSSASAAVDLSGSDEDLPPLAATHEAAGALEQTARPLIEKWIAEELPALAERLMRARLNQTRRD